MAMHACPLLFTCDAQIDIHSNVTSHNPEEEPAMDYDVIPALDDDVQLTVEEYRVKLYEVGTLFYTKL